MPEIRNDTPWTDVDGNPIDCHEGMVLRVGSTYYWYGRRYRGNDRAVYGEPGAGFRGGIVCYTSQDLVNWTPRGEMLGYPEDGWLTEGTWHRPRVAQSPETGQYVMWYFHLMLQPEVRVRTLVAQSSSPEGPFELIGEADMPSHAASGDLAVLVDDDGQAYLASGDWSRSALIVRLDGTLTRTVGAAETVFPGDLESSRHEGYSLAKFHGRYIYATSDVVGIAGSETNYAVADHPLGPWRARGHMSVDSTWRSQISSFLVLPESDTLVALCDRWLLDHDGEPIIGEKSAQLWFPVRFDAATEAAQIDPLVRWDPFADRSTDSGPRLAARAS